MESLNTQNNIPLNYINMVSVSRKEKAYIRNIMGVKRISRREALENGFENVNEFYTFWKEVLEPQKSVIKKGKAKRKQTFRDRRTMKKLQKEIEEEYTTFQQQILQDKKKLKKKIKKSYKMNITEKHKKNIMTFFSGEPEGGYEPNINENVIINSVYNLIRRQVKPTKYTSYYVNIKYVSKNGKIFSIGSFKLRKNSNLQDFKDFMLEKLDNLSVKMIDSDGETAGLSFLNVNPVDEWKISYTPNVEGAGCRSDNKGGSRGKIKVFKNPLLEKGGVWCLDYNSTNNNCGLTCLLKTISQEDKKLLEYKTCIQIKQHVLKLNKCDLILPEELVLLCNYLKRSICVFEINKDAVNGLKLLSNGVYDGDEESENLMSGTSKQNGSCVNILMENNHYFLITKLEDKRIKCKKCRNTYTEKNFDNHKCNPQTQAFFKQKFRQDILVKKDITKVSKKYVCNSNLVFDFESYNDKKSTITTPYAVGLYDEDLDKYIKFYGIDCLEKIMKYIESENKKDRFFTLIGYNSGGFDNYFVFRYLLHQQIKPDVLMKGSRILTMKFSYNSEKGMNDTCDLFAFLCPNSLERCIKDYGIKEIAKGIFPHFFPKTEKDIYYKGENLNENYYPPKMRNQYRLLKRTNKLPKVFDFKKECLKYLESDVMATYEVFKVLKSKIYEIMKVDVKRFITISQLSYAFNRSLLEEDIEVEIPKERLKYKFFSQANYGGRTNPVKQRYTNKEITTRIKIIRKRLSNIECYENKWIKLVEKMKYQNILKDYRNEMIDNDDYLIPFDVKSLYPTTYKCEYPVGKSKYINFEGSNKKPSKDNIRTGIYRVNIKHIPQHIIPVMPQKQYKDENDAKGWTTWDLIPRNEQYYTSVYIKEGLRCGYKFEFIDGFYWEETRPFLNQYLTRIYGIKQNEDDLKSKGREYNPSLRATAKILLNSLFGKFCEKRLEEEYQIITNETEGKDFFKTYKWNDVEDLDDGRYILFGEKKNFSRTINKPIHIGAFILDYSKVIMNKIFNLLDPHRFTDMKKSMENSWYYSDTDCVWIKSSQIPNIKSMIGSNLGDLEDELEGGICYNAYFISPKVYCAEYIDENGNLQEKLRAKGHAQTSLCKEHYELIWDNRGSVKTKPFKMISKIKWKLNSTHRKNGCDKMSMVGVDTTRTLNYNSYNRRIVDKETGYTYPHGFNI